MQLALAGKEVTLVEKKGIGGQCLHHGCMVVCALNDAARVVSAARTLHTMGIADRVPEIDFPRLLEEMAAVQQKIASILDAETKSTGVEVWYGREGSLDGRSVTVDGEEVRAGAVIAATGSFPRIPDLPGIGLPGVYNPHTLSRMPGIPRDLLIIGGGIMAAEFAFIFREFGSRVHLAARSRFLKGLDPKLTDLARKDLSGVDIIEQCEVRALEGPGRVAGAELEAPGGPRRVPCDAVFVAAGLVPNSGMLHGLQKGPDGRVLVDRCMRTSVPGIWACGDVTGSPCLTPVARHEGMAAAASILGEDAPMDYRFIPQSMNLSREYAFVSGDPDTAVSISTPGPAGPGTFWEVPSGMTGLARVLVDPETGAVKGVSTAGPAAGIIAAYQAFLMKMGVDVHAYSRFMEVHPMSDGVYPLERYASQQLQNGHLKK
jgi:dihydrolipoamide dehydrogenase